MFAVGTRGRERETMKRWLKRQRLANTQRCTSAGNERRLCLRRAIIWGGKRLEVRGHEERAAAALIIITSPQWSCFILSWPWRNDPCNYIIFSRNSIYCLLSQSEIVFTVTKHIEAETKIWRTEPHNKHFSAHIHSHRGTFNVCYVKVKAAVIKSFC